MEFKCSAHPSPFFQERFFHAVIETVKRLFVISPNCSRNKDIDLTLQMFLHAQVILSCWFKTQRKGQRSRRLVSGSSYIFQVNEIGMVINCLKKRVYF